MIQANPNVELIAVCDINEALKDTVPGLNSFSDYHVMLEEEDVGLCSYLFTTLSSSTCDEGMCRKRYSCISGETITLNTDEGLELVRLEEEHPNVKIVYLLSKSLQ